MELRSHEAFVKTMNKQGVTLRPLARQVGRSVTTVQRLRSGRQKSCTREVAEAIVRVLDVPLESLFREPPVTSVPCPCAVRCTGHKAAA